MAAFLVALFFCLPPQVYLYPAAQKCSVILPVLPASWSRPFCSFFSCAYAMSVYERRRGAAGAAVGVVGRSSGAGAGAGGAGRVGRRAGVRKVAATGQEAEADGGLMHKMRTYFFVSRPASRSSKFSTRDRSWSFWRAPRGSQLMLLFISWSLLLLLLGMPGQVKGSSELLRVDGQTGAYVEDLHRGNNKGTDDLSPVPGISGRRYKHGEPPPTPRSTGEGVSGTVAQEPELEGSDLHSSRPESENADGFIVNNNPLSSGESSPSEKPEEESAGLKYAKISQILERLHVGSLLRDCLRVKCSPLSNFDMKQQHPLQDETPRFVTKAGSPTFQGPMSSAPEVAIIPPSLEWGSQPVYAPRIVSLTVVNTCNSTRLTVFQPFSTDVQFYTSSFEEKVVDPGDELAIPIVFLPRAVGVADALLIVQTSAGGFLVQAQGRGVGSPYKVQPLQGLRVTSGETLMHTITLHNPHDEVLTVSDVYAWPSKLVQSSLFDSNSLRSGECDKEIASPRGISRCVDTQNGPIEARDPPKGIDGGAAVIQMRQPGQLEIGPHSSIPIAELEFSALTADKYSGSLHIKFLRGTQESDDVLILPIDVQVGEAKGDVSPVEPIVDVLEFGVLTKEDQTSKVNVVLYNPGAEAVQVEDISLLLEDENIVYIEYKKGLVLPPKSETDVAVVTYMGIEETVPSGLFECHPRELLRDRKLIVRTNSSVTPLVEVPYRALVFHGSVDCDLAQGSVGFVPQRSGSHEDEGVSGVEGGALSEQRVRFLNDLSVPLPLFMDIERIARATNPQLLPSAVTGDRVCCHESSQGHLTVSMGDLSIISHTELLYPVVQIGSEELHLVKVTNPSDKPLYIQLLVSTKAESKHLFLQNSGKEEGHSSDFVDHNVACGSLEDSSRVFSFAHGAVVEVLVEPHGEATLGPVVFRPPEQCQWTGLLSLWNNLTQVEWVPLQGSGGSASLTILDGQAPVNLLQLDFNVTKTAMNSGGIGPQVAGFLDGKLSKTICSQEVAKGFWAKNTGDLNLDISAVEFVGGGGCSGSGFRLNSCDGFSLAPGQSAELFVSFQPDLTTAGVVVQRDLQFITSIGVVQISLLANLPEHVLPLCLEMSQTTKLEKAFLYVAIAALIVVLAVFYRLLVQELALSQEQISTSALKCVPQHKIGGRQSGPILFPPSLLSGRLKCGSGEPEVQSRTGDGTGASGPGRPTESIKGLVRALKGVAESLTSSMVATAGSEDNASSKAADMAPPAGLPGLRVKIPNSSALSGQKTTLGSPMRESSSPSSAHFRKGMIEKRNQAKFDGGQAKVAPEPLEESLPAPLKQSSVPKSPDSDIGNNNNNSSSSSLAFSKQGDGENGHALLPTSTPSSNSGSISGSPMPRSPRKGSQFNQLKQGLSPKSRPSSPKSQSHITNSGSGMTEKDKGKRKKRRGNVGVVRHNESVSKGMSGSSSPSSPASPATPASPSRPISPLLHSESQPDGVSPPTSFSSTKDAVAGAPPPPNLASPLAKLDVRVERHTSTKSGTTGKRQETLGGQPLYRRSDSLSVDVASTALREMAQAKATDLSWSTLSGKGNRSAEKMNDSTMGKRGGAAKDWATIARKTTLESATANKEGDMTEDRCWDRMPWIHQNGHCGGSLGPALTPSATFPRRQDRRSELSFPPSMDDVKEMIKPVGSSPALVPVSTIPPAARAPGAKIAKSLHDDANGDDRWGGSKGEYTQEKSNSCGEMFDRKGDGLPGFMSGISSEEDQRVYDIWGNHFGEISRCATQQIGSVTSGVTDAAAPLASLSVLDATPSFFSSFPQPNFPGIDSTGRSPPLSSATSSFSVFSQAPDVETFRLPSTSFLSSSQTATVPSRPSVLPDVVNNVGNNINFGLVRSSLKGHGLGNSAPGTPRKPRGPYSPPLGPSPVAHECAPLAIPATSSDPSSSLSSSFWSGSSSVTTAAVNSSSRS
ncbi:unnamed protein product [Calypogeia fissa]